MKQGVPRGFPEGGDERQGDDAAREDSGVGFERVTNDGQKEGRGPGPERDGNLAGASAHEGVSDIQMVIGEQSVPADPRVVGLAAESTQSRGGHGVRQAEADGGQDEDQQPLGEFEAQFDAVAEQDPGPQNDQRERHDDAQLAHCGDRRHGLFDAFLDGRCGAILEEAPLHGDANRGEALHDFTSFRGERQVGAAFGLLEELRSVGENNDFDGRRERQFLVG